jgi:hypothetical protein
VSEIRSSGCQCLVRSGFEEDAPGRRPARSGLYRRGNDRGDVAGRGRTARRFLGRGRELVGGAGQVRRHRGRAGGSSMLRTVHTSSSSFSASAAPAAALITPKSAGSCSRIARTSLASRGPGGRFVRRGLGGGPRRGAGCGTAAGPHPGRTTRRAASGSIRRGSGRRTCSRAGARPARGRSRAGDPGLQEGPRQADPHTQAAGSHRRAGGRRLLPSGGGCRCSSQAGQTSDTPYGCLPRPLTLTGAFPHWLALEDVGAWCAIQRQELRAAQRARGVLHAAAAVR